MRIQSNQTQALVVDIQEKLFPHMKGKEQFLSTTLKLIKGLQLLKIPFILNEQYPKGIGHTITPIKELLTNENAYEKTTFSCCKNESTMQTIKNKDKKFVIVFGIEAHVCVLQSVIDLLEAGFIPVLVTDCISSRNPYDKEIAIKRMENEGAILTTYESLLFELCVNAKNAVFKEISKLVK
jgi:nicotinamidase-related amidase